MPAKKRTNVTGGSSSSSKATKKVKKNVEPEVEESEAVDPEEFDEESFDEDESDEESSGDEEEDEEAGGGSPGEILGLGSLVDLFAMEGPLVTVLKITVDNKVQELKKTDMSPAKDPVKEILGGTATIVGMLEKIGAVILMRGDSDGLTKSKAQLPAPFDNEEIYGDLLLIRMDADAVPADLTAKEFKALL